MKKQIEVLSPAGTYDAFIAAVNAGCDAVYLGGQQFSARANAGNFDNETLKKTIEIAHLNDVKVYVTANTLIKEGEFKVLYEQVKFLYEEGIDALIIQDIGVYQFVKQHFPDLPIHGSTQMTVHNLSGSEFVKDLEFERIVLSRECDLEEIRRVTDQVDIDVEVFVHGALCYCYSGQCLMSSVIGGRSGNRGQCAQPCRLPYSAMEDGQYLSSKNEQYVLSPKDIMSLRLIPKLIDAGIHSLKIEGRMKSPVYVGLVTGLYRKYVDMYLNNPSEFKVDEGDIQDIMQVYNRGGFTSGYLENKVNAKMLSATKPNHFGVKIGQVTKVKGNQITFTVDKEINPKDYLEITTSKGKKKIPLRLKEDIQGKTVTLFVKEKGIQINDYVYRLVAETLNDKIKKQYVMPTPQMPVKASFRALIGSPAELTIEKDGICITVKGNVVEGAKKASVTEEKLLKQLNKTGNALVHFENIELEIDDHIFLAISEINRLRREGIEQLITTLVKPYKRDVSKVIDYNMNQCKETGGKGTKKVSILIRNMMQFEIVSSYAIDRLYVDYNCFNRDERYNILKVCKEKDIEVYFALPRIMDDALSATFVEEIESYKGLNGVIIRTFDQYQLLKSANLKMIIDYTLNVFNTSAIDFWTRRQVEVVALSNELNEKEVRVIANNRCELLVYGYLPVMVSKQCIYKNTTNKCVKDNESLVLRDRKGKDLLVQKDCKACLNIIYNSEPTVLLDKLRTVEKNGVRQFRLEFVNESKERIIKIMDYTFRKTYNKDVDTSFIDYFNHRFTRGHFNRGVR